MGQQPSTLGGDPNRLQPDLVHTLLSQRALNHTDEEEGEQQKKEITETIRTIRLLYATSTARIHSLAEKVALNEYCGHDIVEQAPVPVKIPIADSWDFCLGDWVRIKYSMSDFQEIQKKTLGWHPRLHTIHSSDAVITRRLSRFENEVMLYTPSRLAVSAIYAGLLEKIPESERQDGESFESRWRVNDYVVIDPKKKEASGILQIGLDNLPIRYLGRRGRVIAVTKVAVVVTFNERTSYDIKSSLLTKSFDQSPLIIPQRRHERGFVLGQKVQVSTNIRKVIENQKGHGCWASPMTKCIGKEVTIVHIRKSGNVMVQYKLGKSWQMNPDSLNCRELAMPPLYEPSRSLYRRGDVVRVSITDTSTRPLLRVVGIPTDFLEYLRCTAKVELIDDDFDYLVAFNGQQTVSVQASTISRVGADSEERLRHDRVKSMVKDITIGTSVCIDVGPPTFVTAILRDSGADHDVVTALTMPATVRGFASDGKIVIEYDNGKKYKIKRKYLTVPEKFKI